MGTTRQRRGSPGAPSGAPSDAALGSLVQEQAALHKVARLVAEGVSPAAVLAAVVEEAAHFLDADIAAIDRFDPDDMVTLVAARGTSSEGASIGSRTPVADTGNAARVRATGRPARIDRYTEQFSRTGYHGGFRAAVSVPIIVNGAPWGAMTVATTHGGQPFPASTEERLTAFTELAGLAISNAQAHQALADVAEEQAALRRVATMVARRTPVEAVFTAVVEEVGRLVGCDTVEVVSGSVGWSGELDLAAPGAAPESLVDALRVAGLTWAVGRPIHAGDQNWGSIVAATRGPVPLPVATGFRLEAFADLAAIAIMNDEAQRELAASRARVVASADAARRRMERDLHDGVQQHLVALAMELTALRRLVPSEQTELGVALEGVSERLAAGLEELREFARGIHPGILRHGGLALALKALVRRSLLPVELTVELENALPERVSITAYYLVAEALTNAAKHARASRVQVDARLADGCLHVVVRDDGVGGAAPAHGSGLLGLRDRVEAAAGRISVHSPPGEGTELVVVLPLAVDSPP